MEAEALGQRLELKFADRVVWTARSKKRLYLSVDPADFDELVAFLRAECPDFRIGTSTGIDTRGGIGVLHHFAMYGLPLVVTVKMLAEKPDPVLPSLAKTLSGARFIEREMMDLLGVTFTGHPDPRRLLKATVFDEGLHPLRRDFDVKEFKKRIGEEPEF